MVLAAPHVWHDVLSGQFLWSTALSLLDNGFVERRLLWSCSIFYSVSVVTLSHDVSNWVLLQSKRKHEARNEHIVKRRCITIPACSGARRKKTQPLIGFDISLQDFGKSPALHIQTCSSRVRFVSEIRPGALRYSRFRRSQHQTWDMSLINTTVLKSGNVLAPSWLGL